MRDARWLLTFGDLLTLLLCFSLATVSLAPVSETGLTVGKETRKTSVAAPQVAAGTTIAPTTNSSEVRSSPLLLPLGAKDFEANSTRLQPGSWERVKTQMAAAAYRFDRADIESCGDGEGSPAWLTSITRALELRRQLIDSGVPAQAIRLRTRGPACDADVALNVVFRRE